VFSFHRPSESLIHNQLDSARDLPLTYGMPFVTEHGPTEANLPRGYVRDHTRSEIGHGEAAFEAAKSALRSWQHFDLGWVRVANPEARLDPDQLVAVEAHTPGFSRLGLWSVNISRILYLIDEPTRFGFAYGTTPLHLESGEERFLVEFYPVSGTVSYELLAISRPVHWLARLGYPYTRHQQHRFARDSHAKMKHIAATAMKA
jgi:uncharacterized protein (UPF0548 family)